MFVRASCRFSVQSDLGVGVDSMFARSEAMLHASVERHVENRTFFVNINKSSYTLGIDLPLNVLAPDLLTFAHYNIRR